MSQFQSLGGKLELRTVTDVNELFNKYQIVIDCTGLNSTLFSGDSSVYPIRGQIVIVSPPAGFPKDHIFIDEETPGKLAYIVPRSQGVLLGGTEQANNWNTTSDPKDVQGIIEKTQAILPQLKGSPIIKTYAGLRPARKDGVRLELGNSPPSTCLVHNYGHGGSGWTVSWGCAQEVTDLVRTQCKDFVN